MYITSRSFCLEMYFLSIFEDIRFSKLGFEYWLNAKKVYGIIATKELIPMNIELICPIHGETVSLLTQMHKDFFKSSGNKDSSLKSFDYMNLWRQGVDNSFGEPVKFQWKCNQKSKLHISLDRDFADYSIYDTSNHHAEVYNLMLGKTYYWRVCTLDGTLSETACFSTEDAPPRWIKATDSVHRSDKGITNIRDLGGWKCENGMKIKQGLLFRGSEMDDHCTLTDVGRKTLLDDLKIKTDYDLRFSDLPSPLGDSVQLIRIPLRGTYGRISEFKDNFRDMLRVFSDESNYPIYIHCWGGADRTGTLLFLLCALLGMNENDLFLEYELTSFSVWGPRSSDSELFTAFKNELSKYGTETDSLVTKSKNFVLSTGITMNEINEIKNILLEPDIK